MSNLIIKIQWRVFLGIFILICAISIGILEWNVFCILFPDHFHNFLLNVEFSISRYCRFIQLLWVFIVIVNDPFCISWFIIMREYEIFKKNSVPEQATAFFGKCGKQYCNGYGKCCNPDSTTEWSRLFLINWTSRHSRK